MRQQIPHYNDRAAMMSQSIENSSATVNITVADEFSLQPFFKQKCPPYDIPGLM